MKSVRRSTVLTGCVWCVLTGAAVSWAAGPPTSAAPPDKPAPTHVTANLAPTVLKVEPNQVAAGQNYTLNLTGLLFQPAMQLDFGPGIVIGKGVTVLDASHARVPVQVTAGTPAGRHLVSAALAQPGATNALPALKNQGPGYVDVTGANTGALNLELIVPRQVAQGQAATLTLTGLGFSSGMSVSVGPGITATAPVDVQGPQHATLAIQVAAQAPPIVRHPTVLLAGHDVHVSPEASLTVTAATAVIVPTPAPTLGPTVPVVLAVSPGRVFAGESYTLTLRGLNLVPQMNVDLGPGITSSGGLRVQSPSLATLDVTVTNSAVAGMRWVGLLLPSALTAVRQDASLLVQQHPLAVTRGFAPQPGACKPPHVYHGGTILLDSPYFEGYTSDLGGRYNVPVMNDQTNLTWHEANAGLADRYEVRFYSGGTLVLTRALTASAGYALPHNLRADPQLIATLTEQVAGRAVKLVNQIVPEGGTPPAVAWDLAWEVVGFHTFYDTCVSASGIGSGGTPISHQALGTGREIEVEHSEIVPITQPKSGDPLLDLPDAPTGMACNVQPPAFHVMRRPGSGPAPQAPPPQLFLTDTSTASQANGATTTANYVGDLFQFSGQHVDFSGSPWALQSQLSVSTANSQYPVATEAFNNVFVDWGDGTIEPFTVQWHGQYCGSLPCFATNTQTSNAQVFNIDSATNQNAFGHRYAENGSFDVRVYVLPAGMAAQQGALPASLHAGSGGLYGRLLTRAGNTTPGGSNAGDLAYMLFCQTENIQHRTDPVSNGPLQLQSVSIVGFPDAPATGGTHIFQPQPGHHPPVTMGKAAQSAGSAAASVSASAGASGVTGSPAAAGTPLHLAPGVANAGALRGHPVGGAGGNAPVPQFSSCDASLVGGAALSFMGEGTAKLTWYQDGKSVGSSEEPIGPSTPRSDAQLMPPQAAPNVSIWGDLHSPALSLSQEQIGQHQLSVTAEVVQDTHPVGRVLTALNDFGGGRPLTTTGSSSTAMNGAPPMGVLGPMGAAASGLAPIVWTGQPPSGAPGIGLRMAGKEFPLAGTLGEGPPNRVVSAPADYQTTSADPTLPCMFNFPVKGGSFVVAGLQHGGKATVQSQGGSYSGTGVLQAQFADASGTGTQPEPVPIHLTGWTMQPDGVTVASGTFDDTVSAGAMHVPGLTATLGHLAGSAGDHVTATLTATLTNIDIPAASGGQPPPWTNVAATLSPQGDWLADQLPIPTLLVYDSGYSLSASSATLDLSQSAGQGADPMCQGSGGSAWMGVLLNNAKLTAYNFNLQHPPVTAASGWALDSYGFCGQAHFASASFPIDQGNISWSGIATTASQGSFSASYQNLKVHVPWLNTDLSASQSATQLAAGQGAGVGGIKLNLDTPASVTLTEGPIILTASHLSFAAVPNAGGWAAKSDTTLTFSSQQGKFASNIVLSGFDYGMNGVGSFADGSTTQHISLAGQQGNIGGSLVDLKTLDVTVSPASSATRLAFAFDSTLNLSKTLPAADVAVSYSISQASGSYAGSGPVTAPFKLDKPFPDANPSVHLSMTPKYVGGTGSAAHSGILFSSDLDLGMFGGPPVSGQFVLGYVGSDDYWVARALLDLGPTGIAIVPPFVNLYKVGGGMGYNVSLSSFQYADLTQATPQDDGTLLFDASLLVGSPDHTTFGLTGDFVIKPGGQDPGGRMDYHAWLLDPDWSGNSPIYGYFSYSGGVFDGTLNAHYSALNDQVLLDATNNAIHMHIGGGQWYYHFGTQNNPIRGQLFYFKGQAWADLGSDGFGLGLITKLDPTAGDCGDVCAYIHDDWTVQAAITPSPLSFSASTNDNLSVGACADGFCLNAGLSAGMSLSLPPPYLKFNFSISNCPPGHVDVGLQVLPNLHADVGAGLCL
jgi:hypothetical protein